VNAYPSNNGTGVPQASANFTVAVSAGSAVSKTVLLSSSVSRVLVTTLDAALTNTSSTDVFATALNGEGNVVLTAPNRWIWSTSAPQIFTLTSSGSQTNVRQGDLDGTGSIIARENETGLQGELALSALEPRKATVSAEISWGSRSRGTGGLNSALSARITVDDPRPQGSLSFLVNREASLGAYTQTRWSQDSHDYFLYQQQWPRLGGRCCAGYSDPTGQRWGAGKLRH
jgi:hypothetical protein